MGCPEASVFQATQSSCYYDEGMWRKKQSQLAFSQLRREERDYYSPEKHQFCLHTNTHSWHTDGLHLQMVAESSTLSKVFEARAKDTSL